MILLLLKIILGGLISIIRCVVLLISYDIGRGHIDVVVRELSRLKFYSGIDLIIAKIFRLILILHIVLVIFFLSNLRELFIFDEWLVHLKSFWFIFYEVSLLILLIAHHGLIFELYKLTMLQNEYKE